MAKRTAFNAKQRAKNQLATSHEWEELLRLLVHPVELGGLHMTPSEAKNLTLHECRMYLKISSKRTKKMSPGESLKYVRDRKSSRANT